jgi:Hypoxanthine-guanine phosphoribosyltransferase
VPIAFTGFNLTGKGFLVGFGMDYAERYRELDAIYELIREG